MISIENLEIVYNNINKLKLNSNDTIIVAVSGGPDSMALLHLLIKNREVNKFNIVCAHVDHNVRKESASELLFVKEYCGKNNVIFESMKIEEKITNNFESIARNIRYNFFKSLIKKYNAKYLFTAHHGDDLIETILMRIVRGSNLNGYAGFKYISKQDNYYQVKPLITVTKQDIINYNKDNNIDWVEDKTNKEDIHTRNRYRNYILPKLKEENKQVNLKFLKYSETLLEANDYIESQVDKVFASIYVDDKINLSLFNEQDRFIKKCILYRILKIIYQDDIHNINDKHIDSLLDLSVINGSASCNLPLNKVALKNYKYIYFTNHIDEQNSYNYILDKRQELPNKMIIEVQKEVKDNSNFTCLLNSSEIELPLIIRTKTDGDRISVKNLDGSKKVSDIFITEKVDKDKRELWPIVTDSKNNVLWIPGLKKSKYSKQFEEKYDIILRYY